jgi:hypothetical protein
MLVIRVYILGVALFPGEFRSDGMVLRVCIDKESRREPSTGKQFTNAVKLAVVCGASRYGMALEVVLWVGFR